MPVKQLSDYDQGYCGGWNDAEAAMNPVIAQRDATIERHREVIRELRELCEGSLFYVLGPPTFSREKKYCSVCGAKWGEHWPDCRLGIALKRSEEVDDG